MENQEVTISIGDTAK